MFVLGATVPGNGSSREREFYEMKVPQNESSVEQNFVPRSESS